MQNNANTVKIKYYKKKLKIYRFLTKTHRFLIRTTVYPQIPTVIFDCSVAQQHTQQLL